MPNPRLVKSYSLDGVPSDRGQCDWADRPMSSNLVGDRLQITDQGYNVAVWNGSSWVLPAGSMIAVVASRDATMADSGKPLKCSSGSAIAITIQNDATSLWPNNETLVLYQDGVGAISFVAGVGVTIRGTPPTVAQYGTLAVWRVGVNEWAYL